ncbi:hypothetical protein HMPREF3213_01757, partial [Heyndrickxia coagulans]
RCIRARNVLLNLPKGQKELHPGSKCPTWGLVNESDSEFVPNLSASSFSKYRRIHL